MYLQMVCNTLRAVSLVSSKGKGISETEVINCEFTASQGGVSHTKKDRGEAGPSWAAQVKSFFKFCWFFFKKVLLLLFQADFLWLC